MIDRKRSYRGYDAPSVKQYGKTHSTLMMEEPSFDPPKRPFFVPETLILRCSLHVKRFEGWPVLRDGGGEGWCLEEKGLYSEEGNGVKESARVASLSLVYEGVSSFLTPDGAARLWEASLGYLPFKAGERVFEYAFDHPPKEVALEVFEDPGALPLFSLGGCHHILGKPLEITPLYFCVDGFSKPFGVMGFGEKKIPNVRLLFWSEIRKLMGLAAGPEILFPEGEGVHAHGSPLECLLSGGMTFSLENTPTLLSYASVDARYLNTEGDLIELTFRKTI